ncbi:MAG: nitroreductase family deazaflavin-dependent oxidoreductase [Dehalococcoidia bacterium]|jgi:deazaflavin-dependent oxidoreductase (nitroreductase family)|nr:nitroreductase family deazaflavin-dependent oxidoreductase [Dehalococcoidia bacterium]
MTSDVNDMNARIIEEFRGNAGNVGGPFEGRNMLLLHNIGAKSGAERINPLVYQALDRNFAIFASKGGAPTNPAWYYNLVAHPDITIEVGTETLDVRARVAAAEERDQIWTRQKEEVPTFADYEVATSRVIPVVVLERR